MSNLNPSASSDYGLLKFFQRYPALSHSLLSRCDHDLEEITLIIEPVLNAHTRCQLTSFYIHGVSLGHTAFLATNLSSTFSPTEGELSATTPATSWLIGRAIASSVTIADRSVSRCHAVIGHHSYDGFFLADVGSRNGTWVNGRPALPQERIPLRDGDILQFGNVSVEFFSLLRFEGKPNFHEVTHH